MTDTVSEKLEQQAVVFARVRALLKRSRVLTRAIFRRPPVDPVTVAAPTAVRYKGRFEFPG